MRAEPEIPAPPSKPEPEKPRPEPKAQYAAKEQITKKPQKPKPAAKKEEPKEAAPPKEEKVVLKKPSILGDIDSTNIDPAAVHNLSGAEGGNKAVRASFTNFPYPWYRTLVHNALWEQWTKRMPKNRDIYTLVSFTVDRHGAIYGVQIEKSSGDDSYDYAAMAAVNNSVPYPPLPKDYPKDILTVTVEFKSEE
jgi:protein TonB